MYDERYYSAFYDEVHEIQKEANFGMALQSLANAARLGVRNTGKLIGRDVAKGALKAGRTVEGLKAGYRYGGAKAMSKIQSNPIASKTHELGERLIGTTNMTGTPFLSDYAEQIYRTFAKGLR